MTGRSRDDADKSPGAAAGLGDPVSSNSINIESLVSAGTWQIGEFHVSFGALTIEQTDQTHRLPPKAMSVLLVLVRNAGETVSRNQLLDMVWPDEYPTPDVVSQAVRQLRQVLGSAMIHTVPKIGYRFCAERTGEQELTPTQRAQVVLPDTRSKRGTAAAQSASAETRTQKHRGWLVIGIAGLALAVAVVVLMPRSAVTTVQTAEPSLTYPAVTNLTSKLSADVSPSVAPEGERFAYVEMSPDSKVSQVILSSIDGLQRIVLSESKSGAVTPPMWSRDGSQLIFQRHEDSHCTFQVVALQSLSVVDRSTYGECLSQFAEDAEWAVADRGLWLSRSVAESDRRRSGAEDGDIESSPGTHIVFRDSEAVDHALTYERSDGDFDLNPRQSPDGRWIAFRRGLFPQANLFLMASDGGQVRKLTQINGYYGRFDWYPDGEHLLVSSAVDGAPQLYRLNIHSLKLEPLNIHSADDVDIGGNKAVFERIRRRAQLREYDLDTQEQLPSMRSSNGNDGMGAYAPDGQQLAFLSDRSGSSQVWVQSDSQSAPIQLSQLPGAKLRDLHWSENINAITLIAKQSDMSDAVAVIDPDKTELTRLQHLHHETLGSVRFLVDGKMLVYTTPTAQGWSAYLAQATDVAHPRPLSESGRFTPVVQVQGGSIYLTDSALAEIIRFDPPYVHGQVVMTGLPQWTINRWQLADGAVWYIGLDRSSDHFSLHRAVLPGPFQSEIVSYLPGLKANSTLSIAKGGQRALLRDAFAIDRSDIAVIDLY